MSETFPQLFEESMAKVNMSLGAIITAKVVAIGSDYVTLSAGLKSESIVPCKEFLTEEDEMEVAVGDEVEVMLDAVEDGFGETILSREKAKRLQAWQTLEKAQEEKETVTGTVTDKVKGGFTVKIGYVRAFLPGSQVDVRPMRDLSFLEGRELQFKVIKMDHKRNNIVVSRRAVLEEESSAERQVLLESIEKGQEITGIVKNLTDYGAFIDLGGIDGLLHITDISWKRVQHPSDVLSVGQEVKVVVLSFDKERKRVSLGMKQLEGDPWKDLIAAYPEGTQLHGKVTNIADYGCFVEIKEGIEGLVHMSEMDWTNKNIHPSKIVQQGDEIEVMVLEIDDERRRISLGMKQCTPNPWEAFSATHQKDDVVEGNIRSITDFGVFIGLDGKIDGLVHLSDISWSETGEEAVKLYKKGQAIKAKILAIDPQRERISLGIKQLDSDPFSHYLQEHDKGSLVSGRVIEVKTDHALVELESDVLGFLAISEIASEKIEDINKVIKVDDNITGIILNVDKKKSHV